MKKLITIILILTVASAGLIVGCAKEEKKIKIGAILPLTGDGAAYGEKEKDGIDLAAWEVNEDGGIGGRKIEVIYEDSKGVPEPATSALQKLITRDKVKVVIGDAFSSPTLAMVPIIDKNRIIMISPSASSPKLSHSSDYFFRVWPSDVAEASIMAEVAMDRMKLKKFALIYGNNDYAIGLRDVFMESVKRLGGEILVTETYNEGDTDFRTQLTKIKKAAPDAIYMTGYYKEFAKILIQAKEMGIKAQFLSCGTFPEPEILKIAKEAAEGVVFVQPYFDRNSKDPLIQKFVENYEARFNVEAGIYAAHGYDAMRVLAEAMKIGGISPERIRDALLGLKDFPGVTGKTTFVKGGDVVKPARIMTVKDGEFVEF